MTAIQEDTRTVTRYRNYGGALVPDSEGQWVHVQDIGVEEWALDPLNDYERLRAIESAARWLTDIWAGSTSIKAHSALAEDIERLRAALEGAPHDPS